MAKDDENEKIWIPIEADLESVTQRAEMGIDGCFKLFELSLSTKFLVQTKNHEYLLEKVGEKEYMICGHPEFCPKPIKIIISGSTFGGSFLWMDRLGWGMLMEFFLSDHSLKVTTSQIIDIRIL